MTDCKKTYSGVKIVQQPGGNSSYSFGWGHTEEPYQRNSHNESQQQRPVENKNPEAFELSSSKVV